MNSVSSTALATAVSCSYSQLKACPICHCEQAQEFRTAPDRFHLRNELYRLARCPSCHIVWQVQPPAADEMNRHYTREYHEAIAKAGEGCAIDRWKPHKQLISRFKQQGAILDIGCSSGAFLSVM